MRGTCQHCHREDQFLKGAVCLDNVRCERYHDIWLAGELADQLDNEPATFPALGGGPGSPPSVRSDVTYMLRKMARDMKELIEDR